MENKIYPAIFHTADEGGFWVEFPDIPGCLTQGATLEEAFNMASDALFVFLETLEEFPTASDITAIKCEESDRVLLVKPVLYVGETLTSVAQEIEKGLKEKQFSKNQAAQILGVDRSYLTHIVKGDKTPAPEMAKRIALLLGFDWRIFYSNNV